jgi:hypothetical protein
VEEGIWLVSFLDDDLGYVDLEEEFMVGTARFELATSRTPSVRATRLRYVPTALPNSRLSLGFEQRQETAQSIAQIQQHFAA